MFTKYRYSEIHGRYLIGLFSGFILLVFMLGLGKILVPIFPLGSLVIAVLLYKFDGLLYLQFTISLWFISPFVRRIIDYQSSSLTFGPWILASLLVTAVAVIDFFKYAPSNYRRGSLPFVLAGTTILYGLLSDIAQNGVSQKIFIYFLDWIGPIALGFYVYRNWRAYPEILERVSWIFKWGLIVIGGYGIIQFITAPVWDRFWIDQIYPLAEIPSFGLPEPFEIRVFSMLSAPQSFGNAVVAGIPMMIVSSGYVSWIAFFLSAISLLLSQARATWLGLSVAIIFLFPNLKVNSHLRLVSLFVILVLSTLQLLSIPEFSNIVGKRLDSLSDASSDNSFSGRVAGYDLLVNQVISEYFGRGFSGADFNVGNTGFVLGDSTIFPMVLAFGLLGTLVYALAITMCFSNIAKDYNLLSKIDKSLLSSCIGILAQFWFNNIAVNISAVALWLFLGLNMAAIKYRKEAALATNNLLHDP
jgi:hypothetical protein